MICTRCHDDLPMDAFYATSTSGWCRACYRAWYVERSGGMVTKCCDHCGGQFDCTARSAARRKFCSRTCKDTAKNAAKSAVLHASKPERECPHCGAPVPVLMRADACFCSEKCSTAAHNAAKKARWRVGPDADYVSRAYIIKRDGSRCHLCGKRCRDEEIHLDHLVPVSLGGPHTPENLRVACARCNLSKHNRARDEQLLLVG